MKIIESITELGFELEKLTLSKSKIGFVPTMGALHKGHLSLVNQSVKENNYTIVSIFVNPIQFNDKKDLDNYPRDIDTDLKLLSDIKVDFVFVPKADEILDNVGILDVDLGHLDKIMEGEFRQGHFKGMATIVKRFFDLIMPTNAYFGEKDYQQLFIVRFIVELFKMPINIIGCDIFREPNGLAMSSRNERLTEIERSESGQIYETLLVAKNMYGNVSIKYLKEFVKDLRAGKHDDLLILIKELKIVFAII